MREGIPESVYIHVLVYLSWMNAVDCDDQNEHSLCMNTMCIAH